MTPPYCPFCQHSLYKHNSTRCREMLDSVTQCPCHTGIQYIQGLLLIEEAERRLNLAFDYAITELARRFNK